MTGFAARYFDGHTSEAREVRVRLAEDGQVQVSGDGVAARFPRSRVRVSARLGGVPRYLYLPGGAKCETADHDGVDATLGGTGGTLHALERHWATVLGALLFTTAFLWAGVQYGLPFLARHAAHAVPAEMEAHLGRQSLQAMDRSVLDHTRLVETDRERVRAAFARVTGDLDLRGTVRLELRRGKDLGPNAFALPSGIVVMTDEMVELARSDEEIMGVIAHELGHVQHRHILRSILQNSAAALLLASLLGDVTSVAGLAASIPTFLVEQRYSRAFEYEADAYALDWMRAAGVATHHYAAILQRLADAHGGAAGGWTRYLSTHPSMSERVKAIRENAG